MSQTQEKIVYPDFDKIIQSCKKLMQEKFPEYKNSWQELDYEFGYAFQMDNKFWIKRLKGEVKEFLKAETAEEARKELLDIINVCAMIHDQCKQLRDSNWRYS